VPLLQEVRSTLSERKGPRVVTACQHVLFRRLGPLLGWLGVDVLLTPHKLEGEGTLLTALPAQL